MLACSRTMSYSKDVHKLEVDPPPQKKNCIILLQSLSVLCIILVDLFRMLLTYKGGLCVCAWIVLISSMEMESGLSMHARFQSSLGLL